LSELMKREKDPLEMAMLLTFSLLVQKRSPKITCGLFDFDWKIIYSIISSTATNFIILMQFDIASRRKQN
jgi:7tm Chemosensory receptor